jgi:DNA polymerase-3 subunit epsilon
MRLLAFDVEATGLDPLHDRIVELAVVRADDGVVLFNERIDPGVPISVQASEIHGITNADVAHCARFDHHAPFLQKLIHDAVLVGYGSRRYDTLIVDAELRRANQPGVNLRTVQEIDLLRVWVESEPRTLESAVERFLGHSHDDAHGALPDAQVIPALLRAMSQRWGYEVYDLVHKSRPADEVDRARRFRLTPGGEVVFNFGKHAGESVRLHDDYLEWMLSGDFPPDTCQAIRHLRSNDWRWP